MFDTSRFDMAWFDTEVAYLPCSALVISDDLYDLLAGNVSGGVEYFADVAVDGVALPYVDEIYIERTMKQICGTCHVGFMAATFPVSGLDQGDILTVTAGLKYKGSIAYQKIFHGRITKVTYPSEGNSCRAYLDAFDFGKDLVDAGPGVGDNTGDNALNLPPQITGDVLAWLSTRIETLGATLKQRCSAITVPSGTLLAYPSLRDAAQAMTNSSDFHYLYFTGNNDLVVLDPAALETAEPLFSLASPGILRSQKIDSLLDRVNRVPYQKVGNEGGASVYWVDDSGVLHQDAAAEVDTVTGTYNDTADQAVYPILTADTLRNDILTTTGAFDLLAAQIADETQRERKDLTVRFNPFVDLGDALTIDAADWFAYRLRHRIQVGKIWTTQAEVRAL